MNEKLRADLWKAYGHLVAVAEKTVDKLGEEQAWQFVLLANDWLDIHFEGIWKAYSQEELLISLVYHDFTGLFKEINWCQLLFLAGNYSLLYRNLRFVWELMSRAYYADTYALAHPDDPDKPGPTGGEKIDWLANREEARPHLDWNTVLRPTLQAILPTVEQPAIEGHYRPLWRHLSGCVHPSADLRLRMIDKSLLHARDNFDEQWAKESLRVSGEVFDLIWLVVMSMFPKSVPLLTHPRTFAVCPRARALVRQRNSPAP